jgi:ADP-ribose pyrophosphatase YjhB (NUDIX family)
MQRGNKPYLFSASMEQKIIDIYKKLYSLPELKYKEEVDFNFFRLCQKKYNFVTISIFNKRRETLLIRDLNKNIGWELVGGTVSKKEKLEDSVNRIVLEKTGVSIDELQPIAVLTNVFQWKNRTTSHRGIAFTALARGKVKEESSNVRIVYQKNAPKKMVFQNKKIFQLAKKAMEEKLLDPPYEEIETVKRHHFGYLLNKLLVKRLGNIASNKIKAQIFSLISGKPETVMDASCGDDNLIFKIEKKFSPRLCIGNDISWKVLSFLRSKQKKAILF